MDNQQNIQDDPMGLNGGLPAPNIQPFSVPEGYFEGFAASVLAKIKGQTLSAADELRELSPLLAGLPRVLPYTVPVGYFEENIAGLPFIFESEASVVLDSIDKAMPYAVPQGYFENVAEQVLTNVAPQKAKVVPFFARTWMRAAVAAVIGGVMFIGGYRLLNSTENEEATASTPRHADTTQRQLAQAKKPSTATQAIQKASTADLDAFINSVPLNVEKLSKTKSAAPAEQGEVKELLQNVSVKEMDAFLEQLPTGDEELAVID